MYGRACVWWNIHCNFSRISFQLKLFRTNQSWPSPISFSYDTLNISWGTGSKQQVVTLKDGKDESHASSLWLIQEAHGKKACETGTPIRCGDTVRFFHITTKKRLHSHEFPSSLTPNQQEVSAFRTDPSATTVTEDYDMEGGDKSDDWTILCSTPYWTIGQNVRLYHVATRAHLESSSSRKFTSQNCPRCPIVGELEVSTSKRATSRKNFFRADEQGAHVFKL